MKKKPIKRKKPKLPRVPIPKPTRPHKDKRREDRYDYSVEVTFGRWDRYGRTIDPSLSMFGCQ